MAAAAKAPRRKMWDVLKALGRPRVALMLALGISSGLPFMLIGNTLGFWLADDNIQLATIGALSWVSLTYIIKFIWGAIVDRIRVPLISRLGRRRSWMLVSQVVAGAGLIGMGLVDPKTQLVWLVALAIVAAVGAATQDTAMDAWRIEIAADADELGLLTSAYSLGYRIALIFTEAVIISMAKRIGWPTSYIIFGAAMSIGVAAVLLAKEPARADAVMDARNGRVTPYAFLKAHGPPLVALVTLAAALTLSLQSAAGRAVPFSIPLIASLAVSVLIARFAGYRWTLAAGWAGLMFYSYMLVFSQSSDFWVRFSGTLGFGSVIGSLLVYLWSLDAISGSFKTFFKSHGWALATLMLSTITFYHLCDYMRGPMSNPYYKALAIDKDVVALVRGLVGTPFTFAGIALGGFCSLRLGNMRTLIVGAMAQPLAIGAFALLGWHGGDYRLVAIGPVSISAFQAIMAFDSIAIGFSGVALVAYMSTLTSLGYTATQYALLTSALAWTGKFLKGFSGAIVESLQHGRSLLDAYALFYLLAAALGAPAIVLCLVLARAQPRPAPVAIATEPATP